jgi:hypothetical protein
MLIGFVLYPEVTALDAVGSVRGSGAAALRRPCGSWERGRGPVQAQYGLSLHVDTPYEECPQWT